MVKKGSLLLLILFVLGSLMQSCVKSKRPGLPQEVVEVIDASGINRTEFLKALVRYRSDGDSIKRRALYYLISNMSGHYYVRCHLADTSGNRVPLVFDRIADHQAFLEYENLLRQQNRFVVINDSFFLDIDHITSRLLINTVDSSFDVWAKPPFEGKHYVFRDYCRYILPYRVDNEPAEEYRTFFKHLYGDKIEKFTEEERDLVSLTGYIHILVDDDLHYDRCYDPDCSLPTLKELLNRGKGNRRQLAVFKIKAFRTYGIAAAMDYTPYFADRSGGSFWPVVFLPDGTFLPVLSNGHTVEELTVCGKTAKVFRRTFEEDTSSLYRKKPLNLPTPPFLGNFDYVDVTEQYVPVVDVKTDFSDTARFVYLAVFNNGEWRAVFWSEQEGDSTAVFNKMGIEAVYLPVVMKGEKPIPAGSPFLLTKTGRTDFGCENERLSHVALVRINKFERLRPGMVYHLYHWKEKGWKKVGDYNSGGQALVKTSLFQGCLYLISEKNNPDGFRQERIFTVSKSGRQIFY